MQSEFGDQPGGGESTISSFKKRISDMFDIGIADFASAISRLTQGAVKVNQVFGQGRQRIVELQQSIADTIPEINKLGGGLTDTVQTIEDIARAARRNVIANTEDVKELFLASKFLGQSAEAITDSFLDVGISISNVGDNLNKSLEYVQSIGGNSKEVIDKMRANMEQLNRYQFEGGVIGLTKMAAQASMLRFDMSNTFALAEKVLSPEGAIETASAFQRLGVAAGNLVDPFQLMNQSINDPSGLQESLANVSRQFTYFDEKTKSFKINPQGVLTLREIEREAGIAQGSLAKMGLAAADLDRRLSAVREAGLTVASEEDKQFLANIARMGEGGEYEVQIKDERGEFQTRKLSEITQNEFNKLIEEQRTGPKTLEELTRSQMNIQEIMQNDLSAIRTKVVGGIATTTPVLTGFEGLRDLVEKLARNVSDLGSTAKVRDLSEDAIRGIKKLYDDLTDPNKNKFEVLQKAAEAMGSTIKGLGKDFESAFNDAINKAKTEIKSGDSTTQKVSEYLGKYTIGGTDTTTERERKERVSQEIKTAAQQGTITSATKLDVGGNIKIDINIKSDQTFSESQQQQIVQTITTEIRKIPNMVYFRNIGLQENQNPTLAPI